MLLYLQPKSHSAIPTFDLGWRAALKSEELAQRWHFAPACRRSPQRYQQIDVTPGPRRRLLQAVRCEGHHWNESEWRVTGHDH
jgi:hypothetical protein